MSAFLEENSHKNLQPTTTDWVSGWMTFYILWKLYTENEYACFHCFYVLLGFDLDDKQYLSWILSQLKYYYHIEFWQVEFYYWKLWPNILPNQQQHHIHITFFLFYCCCCCSCYVGWCLAWCFFCYCHTVIHFFFSLFFFAQKRISLWMWRLPRGFLLLLLSIIPFLHRLSFWLYK